MTPLAWWGDALPGTRVTDADRLLILALRAYEADLCSCGRPRSESWAFEHDKANPAHTAYYDTGLPFTCSACAVLERKQQSYADAGGAMAGRYWAVQLVPRGLALA